MYYEKITAGELRKMDGLKIKALTNAGNNIEGEISVEGGAVYILHNNDKYIRGCPNNMRGYSYGLCIVGSSQKEDYITKEIKGFESIEEFTEGELVYVSDKSEENALIGKNKRVYLYTLPKYICVNEEDVCKYNSGKDYNTLQWNFIVKIPPEEKKQDEETVEMTMEQVNKALGKKIKIIE